MGYLQKVISIFYIGKNYLYGDEDSEWLGNESHFLNTLL